MTHVIENRIPCGLNIPVVSAIIERRRKGRIEILVQTRWKPRRDPVYSGLLEIPAGWIQQRESVYNALRREVFEETGLRVTKVFPKAPLHRRRSRSDVLSFVPLCCQQQLTDGLPWISVVFVCRVKSATPRAQRTEVKNIQWLPVNKVRKQLQHSPQKFFPLHVGALKHYCKHYANGTP